VNEVKLCEDIRITLWRETGDNKWGIIAGDSFGYELGTETHECNFLIECEFEYGSHMFHALIFNKAGARIKIKDDIDVTKLGLKTSFKSRIVCFALVMLLIIWMNSSCQKAKKENQGIICKYKYISMIILTLIIIIIYTIIILYIRIRDMKKMQRMKDNKKIY